MGFVAEVPLKTRRGVLVLCAIGWVAPAINGRSSGRINKERLRQPRDVFLAKVAKIADAFSLFFIHRFLHFLRCERPQFLGRLGERV